MSRNLAAPPYLEWLRADGMVTLTGREQQRRCPRKPASPRSGVSCQKMVVTNANDVEGQLLQTGIALKGAAIYTFSIWLRGTAGTNAYLRIMQGEEPYTTLADACAYSLTANWTKFTTSGGYVSTATTGAIGVVLDAPGTVWMDDASLSYTLAGKLVPVPNKGLISPSFFGMHVANYLNSAVYNPGLEPPYISAGMTGPIQGPIAQNWLDNSAWADVQVTYFQDTDKPHSGVASQGVKVQSVVSGAVQLVQVIAVIPGKQYTVTAWLRGTPGKTVNLALVDFNAPYTTYGYSPRCPLFGLATILRNVYGW